MADTGSEISVERFRDSQAKTKLLQSRASNAGKVIYGQRPQPRRDAPQPHTPQHLPARHHSSYTHPKQEPRLSSELASVETRIAQLAEEQHTAFASLQQQQHVAWRKLDHLTREASRRDRRDDRFDGNGTAAVMLHNHTNADMSHNCHCSCHHNHQHQHKRQCSCAARGEDCSQRVASTLSEMEELLKRLDSREGAGTTSPLSLSSFLSQPSPFDAYMTSQKWDTTSDTAPNTTTPPTHIEPDASSEDEIAQLLRHAKQRVRHFNVRAALLDASAHFPALEMDHEGRVRRLVARQLHACMARAGLNAQGVGVSDTTSDVMSLFRPDGETDVSAVVEQPEQLLREQEKPKSSKQKNKKQEKERQRERESGRDRDRERNRERNREAARVHVRGNRASHLRRQQKDATPRNVHFSIGNDAASGPPRAQRKIEDRHGRKEDREDPSQSQYRNEHHARERESRFASEQAHVAAPAHVTTEGKDPTSLDRDCASSERNRVMASVLSSMKQQLAPPGGRHPAADADDVLTPDAQMGPPPSADHARVAASSAAPSNVCPLDTSRSGDENQQKEDMTQDPVPLELKSDPHMSAPAQLVSVATSVSAPSTPPPAAVRDAQVQTADTEDSCAVASRPDDVMFPEVTLTSDDSRGLTSRVPADRRADVEFHAVSQRYAIDAEDLLMQLVEQRMPPTVRQHPQRVSRPHARPKLRPSPAHTRDDVRELVLDQMCLAALQQSAAQQQTGHDASTLSASQVAQSTSNLRTALEDLSSLSATPPNGTCRSVGVSARSSPVASLPDMQAAAPLHSLVLDTGAVQLRPGLEGAETHVFESVETLPSSPIVGSPARVSATVPASVLTQTDNAITADVYTQMSAPPSPAKASNQAQSLAQSQASESHLSDDEEEDTENQHTQPQQPAHPQHTQHKPDIQRMQEHTRIPSSHVSLSSPLSAGEMACVPLSVASHMSSPTMSEHMNVHTKSMGEVTALSQLSVHSSLSLHSVSRVSSVLSPGEIRHASSPSSTTIGTESSASSFRPLAAYPSSQRLPHHAVHAYAHVPNPESDNEPQYAHVVVEQPHHTATLLTSCLGDELVDDTSSSSAY